MQETLNFLTIIDDKIKRSHIETRRPYLGSNRERMAQRKNSRYPYAKALDFRESKYSDFPSWLTRKDGFAEFMYKSYEKKLMSIPMICEKEERESQEKYFVQLFIQKVEIFEHLPPQVLELILLNLKTRYCRAGEVIHREEQVPAFMAVIYIGSVQYKVGKRAVVRQKNDVILKEAFLGRSHPSVVCREETILLTLENSLWDRVKEKVKREMQIKERDQINDMMKSRFFAELHIKDKKAKQFYDCFRLECYFKDQVIQEAGSDEKAFYFLYRGTVEEENHIYVRQHNKWPMPHRRWQVRAVYNSYHQNRVLKRFDFFGDEEIMENLKFKAKYVAKEWTVILKMTSQDFYSVLNQEDIKRLKKFRAENGDVNYGDFQSEVRKRAQSTNDRKKIVLKAINTSLAHKSEFSPKKMALIGNYERSMMRRATDHDKTISF